MPFVIIDTSETSFSLVDLNFFTFCFLCCLLCYCLVLYFMGCCFTEVYEAVVLYYPGGHTAAQENHSSCGYPCAAVMASQRLMGCCLWVSESLWLLLALNMRWAFLCPHQCILGLEVDWPWDYQWKRRKLHRWGEEMGLEMPQWLYVYKKRRINKGYLLSWKENTFPLSKFPAFLTNSPRSCPFSRLDFIQHQKNSFFLFFIFISCFLTSH